MTKKIIWLSDRRLKPRVNSLMLLLFGFMMGLSGCKSPKTEDAQPGLKIKAAHPQLKAEVAEIVAIANKYALEKGEDLNQYESAEMFEYETYWDVIYDNKRDFYTGDLSIIIDRKTRQPRANDCSTRKRGESEIMEMADKFAIEHGKKLGALKIRRVVESEKGWGVFYKCEHFRGGNCDLGIIISRTTCKPRFIMRM